MWVILAVQEPILGLCRPTEVSAVAALSCCTYPGQALSTATRPTGASRTGPLPGSASSTDPDQHEREYPLRAVIHVPALTCEVAGSGRTGFRRITPIARIAH